MTHSKTTAPYGTWPSSISPSLLVEGSVGLSNVSVCGGWAYWVESRPTEGGRQVLVRAPASGGGEPEEVTPPGFSVRTQVHEYGGRCYAVDGSKVVFSNWDDQRLWIISDGAGPVPLTPLPDVARGERYADPALTPDGRWAICVHERHDGDGGVVNDLVAVATDGPAGASTPIVLAAGHDFYSAPRLSPDGTRLAWFSWDHPDMPWDSTQLWTAPLDGPTPHLGEARLVAGGPGESVTQPRFSPAGVLHYTSDRRGWWNIYDESGQCLCPLDAEFAEPDWVFGNALYGFDGEGRVVATWSANGARHIGYVQDGRAVPSTAPYSAYGSLCPDGTAVLAIAASPSLPSAVVRLDLERGGATVLRASRVVALDAGDISTPRPVEFPTTGGDTAHALFYEPIHSDYAGPPGERPPVLVIIHGGPTSATTPVLNLAVQFWTNRGFAVADVDYRGSTGYGRAYRDKLKGAWGVSDVADCAAVVTWLDGEGLVDGHRAVIRGGSAGGFTTLAALAFTDAFAGGASHFGVADLELLARDTHKFEARYLDGMVGPWPEAADEYRRRSPIHHVEDIDRPLILFQGLEDMIVPPAQSKLMYDALSLRGVPVAYLAFEGEQHGFRRAETVMAVMAAELEFYGRVLGFVPAHGPEGPPRLEIANEARLSPRG